jgi:hypothetical protein
MRHVRVYTNDQKIYLLSKCIAFKTNSNQGRAKGTNDLQNYQSR